MSAKKALALYPGRMQTEQTFRDIKNGRWGLGLAQSQTHKLERLASLLLLGALIIYALWLIGLSVVASGYRIGYGSKKKAGTTLSISSLAQNWLNEARRPLPLRRQLNDALRELASLVMKIEI